LFSLKNQKLDLSTLKVRYKVTKGKKHICNIKELQGYIYDNIIV